MMESAGGALAGSRQQFWNPHEALRIYPMALDFTCISQVASTGGSRCQRKLGRAACVAANNLLNNIAEMRIDGRPVPRQLYSVASLLLCQPDHQYQIVEKVEEWAVRIREVGYACTENNTEAASSDVQAMEAELEETKSQYASLVLKYSDLEKKHAALEKDLENMRQDQISLKNAADAQAIEANVNEKFPEDLVSLEDLYNFEPEILEDSTIFNLGCLKEIPNVQNPNRSRFSGSTVWSSRDDEIPDDEMPTALLNPSLSLRDTSSNSSSSRYSVEQLSILANKILLKFVIDERLRPLYFSALKNPRIGVRRFERNLRRFIEDFAKDLFREAQGPDQKIIAHVVHVCAGSLDLEYWTDDTASDTELNRCQCQGMSKQVEDVSHAISFQKTAKRFISQSDAFDTLRRQLDRFVHVHLDDEVPTNPPSPTITYAIDNDRVVKFTPGTMTTHPGLIDRIKGTLEKWIRSPVIWWPLQPPRTWCPNGYTRISWACINIDFKYELRSADVLRFQACGVDLSVDVPEEVATEYQLKCSSTSSNQPILPLHNNTTHTATTTGNSTQTKTMTPSPTGLFQRSSQQSALTLEKSSTASTNSSLHPDRYVHWCVDANRYETELNHISIPTLDDSNFISKLKSAYRATRGIRQWFSLTDCYGVRFVAFERINRNRDLIACGREDLPCSKTNKDYEYFYRDPREQFIKTLEQSIIHGFHNPRSCTAQDMADIITRIPKKTNGRLIHEYGALGYGMQAVSGWAVWKLMVALFLTQLGPSVFLIKWLCGHPGDLQNAFSLSMYMIGLLNLVVIIPDIWSLQR